MDPLTHVAVSALAPERFKEILDPKQAAELDRTVERARSLLAGRSVWSVNSTARGGGVAEMLASLMAYSRGAGVDARWVVISGNAEFFRVTKRLHNMLHGSPGDGGGLGPEEDDIYRRVASTNAEALTDLVRPGDVVVLHDPQTAGLAGSLLEHGARVVWRAHVGVNRASELTRTAWDFLLPYVRDAEAYVFSRRSYIWAGLAPDRTVVIPPSIDAFSAKNQDLAPGTVAAILTTAGLEGGQDGGVPGFVREDGTPGRVDRRVELHGGEPLPERSPAIVQVSRWDRLKDHGGVLEAFSRWIVPCGSAHLVLAGPSAAAVSDDPEGLQVLQELVAQRASYPPEVRRRTHIASLPMEDVQENAAIVNALQRRADVVVQKSLAEGFGLTVSEAMWKGRPVVAARVGGILDQVTDGESGLLVDPEDLRGFAEAALSLLSDRDRAMQIGARAREAIRGSYLGPRHLTQYVDLFERLLGKRRPENG